MFRWLICIMLACLLSFPSAQASGVDSASVNQVDLDGDGVLEQWGLEVLHKEDDDSLDWHPLACLHIASNDPSIQEAQYYFYGCYWDDPVCYCVDMDGDGIMEILISSNTFEDGYYGTWCLHYQSGLVTEVLFEGTDFSVPYYYTPFRGRIINTSGNTVTLANHVHILGTWEGCWDYTLNSFGRLEAMNDNWCTRKLDDEWKYDDLWDRALTVMVETDYRSEQGVDQLHPGDKILITGSNGENLASFLMEDGREGTLNIVYNPDYVYPLWNVYQETLSAVDGSVSASIPMEESEFFERLPYGG